MSASLGVHDNFRRYWIEVQDKLLDSILLANKLGESVYRDGTVLWKLPILSKKMMTGIFAIIAHFKLYIGNFKWGVYNQSWVYNAPFGFANVYLNWWYMINFYGIDIFDSKIVNQNRKFNLPYFELTWLYIRLAKKRVYRILTDWYINHRIGTKGGTWGLAQYMRH